MSDRITLLSSYNEPDTVEMMDDDDSSSESDDETKSQSNATNNGEKIIKIKNRSNDEDDDDDDDEDDDENDLKRNILNNDMPSEYLDFKSSIIDPNNDEPIIEEDEERKRFQIELEFVQSLANPNYLNFLAQRGYFRNQTFLNYLKYLMYWKEPDYVKYIMYPQCLSLLELLQHEQFLKEIVNAQCSKFIDEQLLLVWSTYKKKRDWIRIDPTKIPDGIEKLFNKQKEPQTSSEENTSDAFSSEAFLANEKF